MKFCPVVPGICRGQVHGPRKERKKERKRKKKNMAAKTRHKKWVVKIQHCPISTKLYMWVDNDVLN
jgi:hypothetical protein